MLISEFLVIDDIKSLSQNINQFTTSLEKVFATKKEKLTELIRAASIVVVLHSGANYLVANLQKF